MEQTANNCCDTPHTSPLEKASCVVANLREINREISKLDAQFSKQLLALLDVSEEVVAERSAAGVRQGSRSVDLVLRGFLMEAGRETNISDRALQTRLNTSYRVSVDLPRVDALHRAGQISSRVAAAIAFEAVGLGDASEGSLARFDEQMSVEAVKPGMTAWAVKKRARHVAASFAVQPLNDLQEESLSFLQAEGLKQVELFDGVVENRFVTSAVEAKIIKDRVNRVAKLKKKDTENGDVSVGVLECETLTQILTGHLDGKFKSVKAEIGITIEPGNYALLEGYGPVGLDDTVVNLISEARRWNVLSLTDRGHIEGVETYEPSTVQRRFLKYRDAGCRWPGCGVRVSRTDIDHTIPWSEGGKTSLNNLANLCRRHHTAKHHSGWKLTQNGGGALGWVSPTGKIYTDAPQKYVTGRKPSSVVSLISDHFVNTHYQIRFEPEMNHPPPPF